MRAKGREEKYSTARSLFSFPGRLTFKMALTNRRKIGLTKPCMFNTYINSILPSP